MKIIIGTESFAPNISGVTVMTELLARRLSSIGHDVYVFAPADSPATEAGAAFDSVTALRFRSIPNPFRKGFRIAVLPQWQIRRAVEEIRPDIIHLQDPASICTALRKAGKRIGVPVIVTNHFSLDYVLSYVSRLRPLHPLMSLVLRRYLVRFYNQCDFVLCPTETVRRSLEAWGVGAPVEAISNGVDLQRFNSYSAPGAVRLKFHLPPGPIVLYVGRIDKDKSIDVLIRAIPPLLRSTNAHFVFAGEGDEVPKLKKLVEKLGLERVVSFLGWIPHDSPDLPQLYQIASVFAIPSTIETQSIVTLEALASGLPVVSAAAGALPELVKDGENGFLFPSGDSEKMADCICRILAEDDLRASMRRGSLEMASKHQIEASFARIESLYEEACNRANVALTDAGKTTSPRA